MCRFLPTSSVIGICQWVLRCGRSILDDARVYRVVYGALQISLYLAGHQGMDGNIPLENWNQGLAPQGWYRPKHNSQQCLLLRAAVQCRGHSSAFPAAGVFHWIGLSPEESQLSTNGHLS